MSPSAFLSVCNTAFRLKEYEWVGAFIEEHRNRILGDNEAQDYYRLMRSQYWFATKNYDKALEYLPPSFQDLDYNLYARRLELKIYYELGADLLTYKIDAFKMYLSRASRKVLPPAKREMSGNFVNIVFQLQSVLKGDTNKIQRILQRVRAKEIIAERDWLTEKVKELL